MLTDLLIALIVLTNFTLVATSRISKAIQVAVIQGVLLGLLPLAMGLGRHLHIVLMVAAAITVKGWLIPFLFRRAMTKVRITREVDPYIGYTASLVLCALGTGLALLLASNLPLATGSAFKVSAASAISSRSGCSRSGRKRSKVAWFMIIGVSTLVGWRLLTRMLWGASSRARVRIRPTTPCLAEA